MLWLNDFILTRRWFTVAINLFCVSILLWVSYANANSEHASFILVGINCVVAGFGIGASVHELMMPGLFRGMTRANEAVMQAEIEKSLNQALAEFRRRHPDVDISSSMERMQ